MISGYLFQVAVLIIRIFMYSPSLKGRFVVFYGIFSPIFIPCGGSYPTEPFVKITTKRPFRGVVTKRTIFLIGLKLWEAYILWLLDFVLNLKCNDVLVYNA